VKNLDLQLPTIQNWSCHNCGGCCKQHVIEITEEEKQRIEGQGWETDPATRDVSVVLTEGKTHRLAHQADGGCVFLDDAGLCRIHAKYGEAAKPLACRIYPYAFHPAGDDIAISLRFSCPSVVANKGQAVEAQANVLEKIARQVVPDDYRSLDPPLISPGESTHWDDFLQFVDMTDAIFAEPQPVLVAIMRTIMITDLLEEASFSRVSDDQITELLQLIAQTAMMTHEEVPNEADAPNSIAKRHLRMLVAQYTRHDTMADRDSGFRGYWDRLKTSLSFTRGKKTIPNVRPEFGSAEFQMIDAPFRFDDPDTIDEILRRYFRVKIQGIHFCGRAYYDVPFIEGLRSLLLVYPAVMWLARWRAAGESRSVVTAEDVATALTVADHNHGYSAVHGLRASRFRVQLLAKMKQLGPLCLWYSRTQ
jgi:lysine-N-methylase